jgi:hypothetical protein
MKERNLPTPFRETNNPLWEDIKKFSGNKYSLATILVLIGLLGIFIPVIPGLLFFLFAIALFKPGLMAKIRTRIKSVFAKKSD